MQQDGQFHDQLFPGSVLTNRHSPCWPTHFPRTLAVGSPSGDTPAPTPAMTTMTPNAVSEPPSAFSTTAGPTSLPSALFTPATTLSPTSSQFLTFLPTSAPATAALSECDVYGGNGYCDLDLNNPDCELDKGDCCPCEFRTKIVIVILIFIRPKLFDSLFYDGQPNFVVLYLSNVSNGIYRFLRIRWTMSKTPFVDNHSCLLLMYLIITW